MAIKTFTAGSVLTASDTNTFLANSGLVYVGGATLSLSTTPSNVTGVFSSTYSNYRVLINVTSKSTTNRVDMRYIVGTTPTTTNYYQSGIASDVFSNTTLYFQRSANDQQFYGLSSNSVGQTISFDIYSPNLAVLTSHHGTVQDPVTAVPYIVGGMNNVTSQFTGFQLFTSTGTATAKYAVYGYREA